MSDEAKTTVPTKEPETPKTGISIKVSAAKPSKPRNFKAEQAKYNAQRQQMLIDAGYTPEAAIAIIRSLNTTYGLQYKDRNECIRLFRNMAERLMYRLENFDRNMSAQIAVTCIGSRTGFARRRISTSLLLKNRQASSTLRSARRGPRTRTWR